MNWTLCGEYEYALFHPHGPAVRCWSSVAFVGWGHETCCPSMRSMKEKDLPWLIHPFVFLWSYELSRSYPVSDVFVWKHFKLLTLVCLDDEAATNITIQDVMFLQISRKTNKMCLPKEVAYFCCITADFQREHFMICWRSFHILQRTFLSLSWACVYILAKMLQLT